MMTAAAAPIAARCLGYDRGKIGWNPRVHLRGGRRFFEEDLRGQAFLRIAVQHRSQAGQFVQDRAQGVDIGAPICLKEITLELLRGHVPERAENASFLQGDGLTQLRHLRKAQIHDDGPALSAGDHDVLRLQIPVNDAVIVDVLNAAGDIANDGGEAKGDITPFGNRLHGLLHYGFSLQKSLSSILLRRCNR